jgi:hypothetical protein
MAIIIPCGKMRFSFFISCFVLSSLLASSLFSMPTFRTDREYPNLGLKCRVIGGGDPEPLAQPKVYTYAFTQGTETIRKDLFDGQELWYGAQHAGQWCDESGNTFIIGRVLQKLPTFNTGRMKHIPREEVAKALAEPANQIDPEKNEDLLAWIKDFTGEAPQELEPLKVSGMGLAQALFVKMASEKSPLVYLFRVKTRLPNGNATKSAWYAAILKIADKTPPAKVRKDFEASFLPAVTAASRSTLFAGGALQPKTAGGLGKPAIPPHPSRDAAKKSIENSKGWWFAETAEYVFLSDIRSSTGKRIVSELQKELPIFRAACSKMIPPAEPISDVSVVRIFEERADYQKYVGKDHEWSAGLWSPSQRELVICSQGKEFEITMQIIRHEAFHQYLFYASGMKEHAVWFNEGHATFLEESKTLSTGKGIDLPESARIKYAVEHLDLVAMNLDKVLSGSYQSFYSGSQEERFLNYSTACALVYFLRKGVPSAKLTAYAKVLETYQASVQETGDGAKATQKAFEGVDMTKFKADFIKFWKFGRGAARKYNPA